MTPAAMTTAPVMTIAARTHALGPLLIFMSSPLVGDGATSGVTRWQRCDFDLLSGSLVGRPQAE
jgi:hypothetical protein